jgi:HSP20 family molecular chaperone IbpA
MDRKGRPDGLTGFEALTELGNRLSALADGVRTAFADAGKPDNGDNHAQGQNSEDQFSIQTPAGPIKGVASYGLRVGSIPPRGPAGTSGAGLQAEVRKRKAPDVEGAREPLVDMFDESHDVIVTAELPGVRSEDIRVTLTDGELLIETMGNRRYRSILTVPVSVSTSRPVHALRNGILEIRLAKSASNPGEDR